MSTVSKEWLEEENRKLKLEVKQLRDELVERDAFVAVLEAQIKALVKESSIPSERSSNGNGPSSSPPVSKKSPPPEVGAPTQSRDNGRSATTTTTKSRMMSDDDDESTRPLTSTTSRRPSLDPPRRRTEVEIGDTTPTRNDLIMDNGVMDAFESGRPRSNLAKLIEADVEDGSSSNHDTNNRGYVSEEIRTRKSLIKAQGTIKALPRELSIRNAEDDDVTKYSVDDVNMPTYYLEASEMRDAYNARGLYTGSVSRKQQVPHGNGIMNYHLQGRSYEGNWVMGHWHGYGKIRCANGDVYEGSVNNDLRVGQGILYFADGRVFSGNFQEDDPVIGTLTFPDGAQYCGELHNQARHGFGTYYFSDGSTYEGMSFMNAFQGHGKMTWPDGGWYEGEWLAGEINGIGKEVRADGSLRHEGQWIKGVPIRMN